MSFVKKNPRLATLLRTEEHLPTNQSPAATTHPLGACPTTSGAPALLCSTGIAGIDAVLGGGLPVASLLTVLEDIPASKANFTWTALVRCFLAETLASAASDWSRRDSGWIGLIGHDVAGLLESLPKATVESEPSRDDTASPDMKIAWRYQSLKECDSTVRRADSVLLPVTPLGHSFDLGRKHGELPKLMAERTLLIDLARLDAPCAYQAVWTAINDAVRKNQRFGLGRLVVGSLGAPGYWNCTCDTAQCGPVWLMRRVSHLIQETETTHPVVVLATIPAAHLSTQSILMHGTEHTPPSWTAAVENVSDAVLELKPLAGITRKSDPVGGNSLLRDYDGFLVLRKPLRRTSSLRPILPETQNLAFKIKRRRFVVEKFHLPPSLDDTAGCSSSGNLTSKSLDF